MSESTKELDPEMPLNVVVLTEIAVALTLKDRVVPERLLYHALLWAAHEIEDSDRRFVTIREALR